jgi:hypothetical protein
MAIRKFRSGQSSYPVETYIGTAGTLFWDEADGELRLSDGVTPGGVAISVRADLITAQSLLPEADNTEDYDLGSPTKRWHHLFIGDGGIKFDGNAYPTAQTVPYLPGAQVDDIIPATDNGVDLGAPDKRWANIYLGYEGLFLADQTTDANINITVDAGTLYVDGAANLAIGNLIIKDTTLKTLNPAIDINIGDPADTGLTTIGRQTVITTPTTIPFTSALLINGATTLPVDPSPLTFNGTMIHTVAQVGQSARIVQDAYGTGNYPIYVGRKGGGTIASPTAPASGELLLRISGNGYGSTGFGTGGSARIDFITTEQFSDTQKGTRIDFWTTPAGSTAITNNASVTSEGFKGNGYTFTGDNTRQTTAGIPLTQKAVPSAAYVATLGIDGKLDATQIPSSLTGAVVFKGVWNATTNTPALSDTTPAGLQNGWEFIVEVGGTRDIGDGSKTFQAGDFVIYDGTHWKQVPSGNAFISLTGGGGITVNQSTGAIILGSTATPNATNGAIVSRDSSGNFAANVITANLTGNVTGTVSGNAGTVTNGVYTTGNQSIDGTKTFTSTIQGSVNGNAGTVTNGVYTTDTATVTNTMLAGSIANNKLANSSVTVNGTSIALGASATVTAAAGTLTGTTLNATVVTSSLTSVGTLTNLAIATGGTITTPRVVINDGGIRTISGGTTLTIDFATDSIILWTAPSGTAVITLSNYTAGAQVKLIIALTTTRDITFGISSAALSSTGADNWNGAGGGAIDISNTAVHLEYTCFTALAAGCYVKVTAN